MQVQQSFQIRRYMIRSNESKVLILLNTSAENVSVMNFIKVISVMMLMLNNFFILVQMNVLKVSH